jgi:glycosyltransferase involved in cell wall biosynthesis
LAWLLLRLRRLHGIRLVFEVHGLPSVELLDRQQGDKQIAQEGREAARLRGLEQEVFDGAWRLLPITECLRQRLLHDYGCPSERVTTIPDAARSVARSPKPATSQHSHGEEEKRPARLIYVGQLYPWKGVDLLLEALAELERAELTIVGGLDNDRDLPRLRRLAEAVGVANRVVFAGPRPYAEVPCLLARADVALLPLADGVVARCFTSPLKLFDYMAAGCPIVAVDFPTIREVLYDGENGLLAAPGDPAALAAQVQRLLDNPELARQLGDRARRDAQAYTWQRRAERITAVLTPGASEQAGMATSAPAGAGR